ncbi:TadE/TadG family type IV pilus assembly protein [Paraburkholderia silviterrae]|uniref:Pilus assembly protein n=1 Tax=Paraburkholderia silviterrae TaxID=2528715 RepID=A0A4R5M1I2_9BURK|nr:TadE/TadG family type IV pilus assembly protein [Paraburkholderia silviterrae]TDG19117.1 pilus assembly protein [Paraburkholderia silviterrae]
MKPRRRTSPGARAHARGIVSLEFVLVLPFLLMLLFGIVDVSMVLCDKAVITNAAGEAARQGVVLRATPYNLTQIQNVALAYTNNSLVTSGTNTPPTVTVSPSGGCASAGSSNPLQVSISYTYNGVVLGSALSAITGPVTVTAVAVKNCE